jgi:uncharacterized protein
MIEEHIVLAVLVFFFAGFIKGTTGLGLPAIVIGLLSLVIPPVQAIALTIVPSFVTNVWQALAGRHLRAMMARFWTMVGGVCCGIGLGGWLLAKDAGGGAVIVLGIVLAAYAVLSLSRVRLTVPARAEGWLSPAAGAATGLLASVTGLNVVPAVPYLQATGLERDQLVQMLGLFLTVTSVAMGANLFYHGVFRLPVMGLSAASLLPTVAGMVLGQFTRRHIPEAAFTRIFLFGLLALGAYLALRALL